MSSSKIKDRDVEPLQHNHSLVPPSTTTPSSTSSTTIQFIVIDTHQTSHYAHTVAAASDHHDQAQALDVDAENIEDDNWSHIATDGNGWVSGSRDKVKEKSYPLKRWLRESQHGNMTFTERLEKSK